MSLLEAYPVLGQTPILEDERGLKHLPLGSCCRARGLGLDPWPNARKSVPCWPLKDVPGQQVPSSSSTCISRPRRSHSEPGKLWLWQVFWFVCPFRSFRIPPGHLRWRNERLCVLLLAQVSELMSNIALSLSVSQIQLRFLHITPSSYRRHSNLKPWQCRMDQSENNLSCWGYFQGVMRSYHGSFRTQPVLDRPLIAPMLATEQEGYVGWGFLWWFIATSMFEFWVYIYIYKNYYIYIQRIQLTTIHIQYVYYLFVCRYNAEKFIRPGFPVAHGSPESMARLKNMGSCQGQKLLCCKMCPGGGPLTPPRPPKTWLLGDQISVLHKQRFFFNQHEEEWRQHHEWKEEIRRILIQRTT